MLLPKRLKAHETHTTANAGSEPLAHKNPEFETAVSATASSIWDDCLGASVYKPASAAA